MSAILSQPPCVKYPHPSYHISGWEQCLCQVLHSQGHTSIACYLPFGVAGQFYAWSLGLGIDGLCNTTYCGDDISVQEIVLLTFYYALQ